MLYNIEFGEIEQGLINQARNANEPLPEPIANKPSLSVPQIFYWNAFFDLDTERSHGQGLTKIPRSAIVAYAAECGLNQDETSELLFVIRAVDNAHLDEMAKRMKSNAKA